MGLCLIYVFFRNPKVDESQTPPSNQTWLAVKSSPANGGFVRWEHDRTNCVIVHEFPANHVSILEGINQYILTVSPANI